MHQRSAGVKLFIRPFRKYRRTIRIVQHSLGQIRRRRHVFQSLLILDADRIAAKFLCDAHRRDIHLALLCHLLERQLGCGVLAQIELHALCNQPLVDSLCFRLAHRPHLRHQSGLAQALFVDARRIQ